MFKISKVLNFLQKSVGIRKHHYRSYYPSNGEIKLVY